MADTLGMTKETKLTVNEANFAMAYLGEAGGDATKAYRLAYKVENSKPSTVSTMASTVLARPHVQAEIARLRAKVADRFEISQAEVLRHWYAIATADVGELIQAQRRCCRHCYGVGFEYQWKDEAEWMRAVANELKAAKIDKREPELPTSAGGVGFNHTLPPVAECTTCRGDGLTVVVLADTRKLEGAAKLIYNGVKQTRDGIEVKLLDRDAAMVNLAKALGIGGDDKNKPPASFNFNFTGKVSAAEAAKFYRSVMG